jgi:sugar/nucleoside kinase (ribokinase family)
MVRQLEELGIGTAGVIVDPTVQTGVTISLTYPHEKAQITYPGSIAAYRLEDVNLAVLDRYTHLHMASMYLQTGLRPAFPALLRRAKSLGLTTSLDPGWDPAEEWSAGLWEALAATDILFVNEHEAWALGSRLAQTPTALKDFAGAASHSQADLAELLMRGLALSSSKGLARSVPPQESLPRASRGGALLLLVAKLGPQGAMVADRGGVIHVPAHRVEVIDTTGAGDSFDAGFIYQYIIEGRSKAEALRFANACGAIAVTRLGGASSVPTAAEVEAFLRPELEV